MDTANVMGARPDGWWRDRAGAAVRLHADLVRLAASGRPVLPEQTGPPQFVMVLEGAAKAASARIAAATAGEPAPGHTVGGSSAPDTAAGRRESAPETAAGRRESAPGTAVPGGSAPPDRVRVVQAPGSGDDAIAALVRELAGHRVVVTADRELRDRCVAVGATVLGPGWLLGLLRR